MSHEQATVAEEEYLQTIYWLQEAGLPITGANIARAMQVSAPTVHEMVGRLEADGYVTRKPDKSLAFTESGKEEAAEHRAPPPADRALPDRRLRHPLGPGPRGGRAARALDVARGRGADAEGDRRRQDLPPRPPDLRGRARARACRWPTSRRGRRCGSCASRTRPRTCCTTCTTPACSPGLEGTLAASGEDEVAIDADGVAPLGHPQRGRDGVGGGRPLAAAARGAAGAARAGARALRRARPRPPRSSRYASASRPTASSICGGVTPE